jgi:hypothetical protein
MLSIYTHLRLEKVAEKLAKIASYLAVLVCFHTGASERSVKLRDVSS